MKKAFKITAFLAVVILCSVLFIACVPSDYEKAVEHLEKAGYLVTAITENDIEFPFTVADEFDGATAFIIATHENDGIIMVYFKSSKKAKAAYDEFKEKYAESESDDVTRRQGKVIYTASEKALEAVR